MVELYATSGFHGKHKVHFKICCENPAGTKSAVMLRNSLITGASSCAKIGMANLSIKVSNKINFFIFGFFKLRT